MNKHNAYLIAAVLWTLLFCVASSHCQTLPTPGNVTCHSDSTSSHCSDGLTTTHVDCGPNGCSLSETVDKNDTPVSLCRDAIHSFKKSGSDADQLSVNKYCSSPQTIKYERYNKWIKEVK